MISSKLQSVLAFAAAGLLILGVGAWQTAKPRPADATPYHRAVNTAADALPMSFDGWTGRPQEVPPAAVELLKPNRIVSRRYINDDTGEVVDFLMVHCKDARDLNGHYPPICYPSQGYTQQHVADADWSAGSMHIPGKAYRFSRLDGGRLWNLDVANFLVLPGGPIIRDMDGVTQAGSDYTRRHFGAAQVQVVTSQDMTTQRRHEIVDEMLEHHQPLLNSLLTLPDASEASSPHDPNPPDGSDGS